VPSSDDSNQLQPPSKIQPSPVVPRTIQEKPATVPVQAVSGVLGDIGDNAITGRAEYIRQNTDEEMIWQETPSLALLLPRFFRYAVLMAIVLLACSAAQKYVAQNPFARVALESVGIQTTVEKPARKAAHKLKSGRRALEQPAGTASSDEAADAAAETAAPPNSLNRILVLVKLGFGGLFTLLFLIYILKLKTTRYYASSQRLIVEEGTLHSVNRPYELHQLGDAVIMKPLLLRIFDVSNLVITNPRVKLIGLRNAEYVRDLLRQGGQLEASRVDKIRFR
jgi:hypothetical protein